MTRTKRPTPAQWLAYVAGRPLSPELREWVRNDLVGPHGSARHLARTQLAYSPIYIVFLSFPGPLWIRGLMVLLALLLSTFYTVAYMDQNISRRLQLNGLPPDLESAKVRRTRAGDRTAYEAHYRKP